MTIEERLEWEKVRSKRADEIIRAVNTAAWEVFGDWAGVLTASISRNPMQPDVHQLHLKLASIVATSAHISGYMPEKQEVLNELARDLDHFAKVLPVLAQKLREKS